MINYYLKKQRLRPILSLWFLSFILANYDVQASGGKDYDSASYPDQSVITGTVYDGSTKNEPLIGVTVLEKGTGNGTVTDFDGNYSIRVAPGSTLVFSFVGFETKVSQL